MNAKFLGNSVPAVLKLDHCSLLGHLSFEIFPASSLSYWGANSYYPRGPIMGKGNSSNPRKEWDRGFSIAGASKLDQMQPFEPILIWYFSNFFTFILGSQFLLPQRANNGKREFSKLQKRMTQWVFSARAIQTGPFAACWAPFILIIFQLFHFHTGEPILITPDGQ